jgi:hypothetical protein
MQTDRLLAGRGVAQLGSALDLGLKQTPIIKILIAAGEDIFHLRFLLLRPKENIKINKTNIIKIKFYCQHIAYCYCPIKSTLKFSPS